MGYVSVLFGGNAVAVHDIESALYGTSLGVSMEAGVPTVGGHEHHLRAINRIRGCGGIRQAVEQGVLTSGLFYEIVRRGVPYVLAGSIRDDGPLPDVITDAVEAQQAMREHVRDAGLCLMLCSMLHSIATGNLLPASVATVCVDINPAVATKLADRGSFQTIGIVTDVGNPASTGNGWRKGGDQTKWEAFRNSFPNPSVLDGATVDRDGNERRRAHRPTSAARVWAA